MVTIWFEPHSTTLDNEAKLASGWYDVDLSELGKAQSLELLERCKDRNLDAIFCSDMQRAVKSAIPTAEQLKLPIYVDRRLRECDYGTFTHKDKKTVDAEKIARIIEPFPEGESYKQCIERVGEFLVWLKERYDGKTVLIIGHRATHYGLDHYILGYPPEKCVTDPWEWQPGWRFELS